MFDLADPNDLEACAEMIVVEPGRGRPWSMVDGRGWHGGTVGLMSRWTRELAITWLGFMRAI